MPPQGRPQAAGRSSQFQPGKYEIFPGRGMSNQKASQKPARSQPSFFDSQKPAKPGKQRPDLARQPGPCRELRKQPFSGRPRRDRRLGCFASPRVEHLLCFVCGRGSASTRQAAARSSQFQPGSTRFFQLADTTRKPARSQPEANQTSVFDSQKPAKPGKQRPDLARQPGPCRELIVQPFSGRPRRSTPGLLRKPTRGIAPSTLLRELIVQPSSGRPSRSTPGLLRQPTRGIVPSALLRLWEGQCLHKAAPRQRGGPASFSQVSTRFFEAGGCPTRKPVFLPAKPDKQRPDLASAAFFGASKAIDAWAASQAHAWNCAIYFASFVGGAVPPQGRPQAAGRSGQFQPGTYEIFPGRGMSNQKASQKPARSQPNLFF